jgi:hypothetical protein
VQRYYSPASANPKGFANHLLIRFHLQPMSFKDVAVKKYVVRLSAEEREYLDQLIRKGKSSAQRLMKARILLKADVGEGGEGWSDNKIIEAHGTSVSMLYRVRKQLVEEGLEAVLAANNGPHRQCRRFLTA